MLGAVLRSTRGLPIAPRLQWQSRSNARAFHSSVIVCAILGLPCTKHYEHAADQEL